MHDSTCLVRLFDFLHQYAIFYKFYNFLSIIDPPHSGLANCNSLLCSARRKLKISVQSQATLEEVDAILFQVKNIHMMHRLLRHRKLLGKAIPTDDESMKLAFQEDAKGIISTSERKSLQKQFASTMPAMRSRRR